MAEKSARGADGREWIIRNDLEWRVPATADDFEHDVAGGGLPAAAMVVLAVLLTGALIAWMPDTVVMPSWLVLILFAIIMFFPARWVWRRPWKVVAETKGGDAEDAPAERWVGTVRGMFEVGNEMKRTKRAIEDSSMPEPTGPLRPVD